MKMISPFFNPYTYVFFSEERLTATKTNTSLCLTIHLDTHRCVNELQSIIVNALYWHQSN